jgi:type VI secretion system protein VasG
MIDNILTNSMLPEMSVQLLEKQMDGLAVSSIAVTAGETGFVYAFG